jgi:muconolactone delta-isomerase
LLFHITCQMVRLQDAPQYADQEGAAISELKGRGVIQRLLLRPDRSRAYIIVEADTEEDARRELTSLPFARNGVMTLDFEQVHVV